MRTKLYFAITASEQFCLKWKEFQNSISLSLKDLENYEDFSDVTLACDDEKTIDANKVILSASSSVFHALLRKYKHPNPLLYMRGISSKQLAYIVDYVYQGSVDVMQEDLDEFLNIAKDLKIKGLTERQPEQESVLHQEQDVLEDLQDELHLEERADSQWVDPVDDCLVNSNDFEEDFHENQIRTESIVESKMVDDASINLEARIDEKIERKNGNLRCTVCGKISQNKHVLRNHIETHLGISHPCSSCGKYYKTTNSLRKHISTSRRL